MRGLAVLLAGMMTIGFFPEAVAQQSGFALNIVVVEGDGAINNIHQRTVREPVVQVEDENHRPVAGAVVVFSTPTRGAGAAFADGHHTLTVITDAEGRAVAHGFRANNVQGNFQIHITASYRGQSASTDIAQSNALAAGGAAGATAAGIPAKLIAVIAVGAAAAAGGALYATHAGGSNSANNGTGTAAAVTITPGAGSVGPPR